MDHEAAIHLLGRLDVPLHPCDLDLLIFFTRHPRCLLPSDSLASFLGYEPKVMAESLEALLAAGVLERTQTSAHAARLYVLRADESTDEWLHPLLRAASTRTGRLALRAALVSSGHRRTGAAPAPSSSRRGPRRLLSRDSTEEQSQTG